MGCVVLQTPDGRSLWGLNAFISSLNKHIAAPSSVILPNRDEIVGGDGVSLANDTNAKPISRDRWNTFPSNFPRIIFKAVCYESQF